MGTLPSTALAVPLCPVLDGVELLLRFRCGFLCVFRRDPDPPMGRAHRLWFMSVLFSAAHIKELYSYRYYLDTVQPVFAE